MSDVVGTSLICENDKCPLNTSLLMTNVTVIFEHSVDLQVSKKQLIIFKGVYKPIIVNSIYANVSFYSLLLTFFRKH